MGSRMHDSTLLMPVQEFSEWAQCLVLEAVSVYRPSGEQEVYDIMNMLDDRLTHSNSAVVIATIKLFLHLTLAMPATHQQVRAPLLLQEDLWLMQPQHALYLQLET